MRIYTQLDAVRKEIAIMKDIRHSNCIRLLEVIEDVPKKQQEYVQQVYAGAEDLEQPDLGDSDDEDEDTSSFSEKIYMIMELARHKEVMTWSTTTYKFHPNAVLLKGNSEFICQDFILKIMKDCLQALAYLHDEARIVHRDLKPQNILVCEPGS